MKAEQFLVYLTTKYRSRKTGSELARRPARDAVSRCRRIESVLDVNLDTLLRNGNIDALLRRMEARQREFGVTSPRRQVLSQLRVAAKLYAAFVAGTKETPKTRNFYPGRYP